MSKKKSNVRKCEVCGELLSFIEDRICDHCATKDIEDAEAYHKRKKKKESKK